MNPNEKEMRRIKYEQKQAGKVKDKVSLTSSNKLLLLYITNLI